MAARMARQRQQRSILRTQDIPLDESLAENAPPHYERELAILRSEVAASGTKPQQSDSELEQMGSLRGGGCSSSQPDEGRWPSLPKLGAPPVAVRQSLSPEELAALAAAQESAAALAEHLLDTLAKDSSTKPPVELPVTPHDSRLSSGERGVSIGFLRGLSAFLKKSGDAHLKSMAFVNRGEGFEVSVCELTKTTGLSLVESLVMVAERDAVDAGTMFGTASNFFSYSWEGSTPQGAEAHSLR